MEPFIPESSIAGYVDFEPEKTVVVGSRIMLQHGSDRPVTFDYVEGDKVVPRSDRVGAAIEGARVGDGFPVLMPNGHVSYVRLLEIA